MENNNIIPIKTPVLSSELVANVQDVLKNIDDNFKYLGNNDFIQGKRGNSINIQTIDINSNVNIKSMLKDAVTKQFGTITPKNINGISVYKQFDDPGKISLVYENVDGENILISSMPYVFKDYRFENITDNDLYNDETDWSCALYFNESDNSFVAVQEFPTLYYEDGFKWKINGIKTGLNAQGPQGPQGKSDSLHSVRVIRKGNNDEVSYKISSILVDNNEIDVSVEGNKTLCENNGVYAGDNAIAMYNSGGGDNEIYIGPIYMDGDDLYVLCNDNTAINAQSSISVDELETLCNDIWGTN